MSDTRTSSGSRRSRCAARWPPTRRARAGRDAAWSPRTAPRTARAASSSSRCRSFPTRRAPRPSRACCSPTAFGSSTSSIELARPELAGRLARPAARDDHRRRRPRAAPRIAGAQPGHWVFVPVLDHACFVDAQRGSHERARAELAVLPAALALDLDGWRRLLTWAPTTPRAARGRARDHAARTGEGPQGARRGRAQAARASRRSRARDAASNARRDPPPLVGRDALLGELSRALDDRARRSVLLVGDEAAGKSALVEAWVARESERARCGRPRRASSSPARAGSASGRRASRRCSRPPRRSTRSSTSTTSARCSPIAPPRAASSSAPRCAATSSTAASA